MTTIRHLAFRTQGPQKLAHFYSEVFGLKELCREKKEGGAIFLTDGYLNLALIPNVAQNATNGLYHLGFQVDDADETTEKINKLGF